AFGVLRVDLLPALTAGMGTGARLLHRRAAKRLAPALRRPIDDAQADAGGSPLPPLFGGRFAAVGDVHTPDPPPPRPTGPTPSPRRVRQHGMLTRAQEQATGHTPIRRVERDAVQAHQARGARIIADAATRAKLWTGLWLTVLGFDRFEGFYRLGSGTDGELRT